MTITTEPQPIVRTGSPRLRWMRYEPLPGEPLGPPEQVRDAAPAEHARTGRPRTPCVEHAGSAAAADAIGLRANAVLRLLLEVLDGRRPVTQLAGHLAPTALRYVRAAGRRGSGRSRLTSLRICRPAAGAAEVAAVYRLDGRARAVAARFERDAQGAWRCAVLRLG